MSDNAYPPGHFEACRAGCTCPRIDNGYGRGYGHGMDGKPYYVVVDTCPLHADVRAPAAAEPGE
jgi:hypothetical protein